MKLILIFVALVFLIVATFSLTGTFMEDEGQIPAFARLAAFAIAENILLGVILTAAIVQKKVKEWVKGKNKKAAKEALELYGKALVN